ncbi:TetR/AcrR family transcriptional regulator [Priestia aryabhattai]|uniref:TetR/AcrR family transcriptional regulator n=1 Tax=Priestia aryabhattai TaxID=412384 RepID=UPI0024534A25|nr:TetR/AcrR family transcriptional regulator [Priestia aryabhattai]MDH3110928.1 TetR/AcrR family transcriptional regulator [Priestia aryabhattai]MDH3124501.1 TetR/AcrR family transcriptional regulator [Priestia aryabhattai]
MSKQQEILSIAREVIHSKGYQATSISDILSAANIGKGQFYHYFSSKYDLGLAVVEDFVQEWDQKLILDILKADNDPVSKLNKMLDWTISYHSQMDSKTGCPFGNLAIEMSEHDEHFRLKIQQFFERWIDGTQHALNEMVEKNLFTENIDIEKHAQTIIAMLEGGILLMKSQQDMKWFLNVVDVIRLQYNLF